MNKVFSSLFAGALLAATLGTAQAAQVADFTTTSPGGVGPYTWSGGMNGALTGTASGKFEFDSLLGGPIGGYSPVAGFDYIATVTITITSSGGSSDDTNTPADSEDIKFVGTAADGTLNGVTLFEATSGQATNAGAPAGQAGDFTITANQNSADFKPSNDGNTFNSAPYIKFFSSVINTEETGSPATGLSQEDISLSLTADNLATYSPTGNPLIDTLDANTFSLSGNFGAKLPPVPPPTTPEPGTVTLALVSMVSLGALRLRRRK
jgi:hypothetical protein